MSDHYEFTLPVGAIISIDGRGYVHAGNGVVYGHGHSERPFVLDGVAPESATQPDVILSRRPSLPRPQYRVVHHARTQDEALRA